MLPSASANWISTFETVRKWNQIRKIEKLDDKIHAAHQNEILYPNCFNTWSSLLSFPPIHINSKWGLLYEFKIFFHQVSWCHVLYKISYPSFFPSSSSSFPFQKEAVVTLSLFLLLLPLLFAWNSSIKLQYFQWWDFFATLNH